MNRSLAEKLGLALLAAVFAVNVYRAAVQSCTVDEATTYNEYASKSVAEILTLPYDANNQILHSILCRWAVRLLGVSEIALRVPSLLGGLLFLVMGFRLCGLYFGRGWSFLTVFGLLALNPFTLDYLSVARGYGLAAGLLLLGCERLSRHLLDDDDKPGRMTQASFALGCSVAANLTFAVPAGALVLVFLHLEMWERRRFRLWDAIQRLILPGFVGAMVLLLLPMIKADRGAFYYGEKSVRSSVMSLISPALVHHNGLLAPLGRRMEGGSLAFVSAASICLLAAMMWASRGGSVSFARRMPLLLMGGTLAVSCCTLFALHTVFGLLYPAARTGLYLVVLFTLASGSMALQFGGALGGALRIAAGLAAFPVVALFLGQVTVGPYHAWVFDSGTKNIVNRIRSDRAALPGVPLTIATDHFTRPALTFYRRRYHWRELNPVEESGLAKAADYYVLPGRNAEALAGTVIYRDPVSGQVLVNLKAIH